MKKSEYIKIVKFSSFFIKKYWYAKYINFFNPLKFHPANLENYLSLKKKKYFFFFLKTLKYFTNSFFDYFIVQSYNLKKTSYDVIVFSNIINEQKKYSINNDYYFGGISNKIINNLVVYRNFTKDNSQIIKKKFLDKNVIILNKKNFILNELKYILYFIIIYFKIKIDYINQKDNKKKIFLKEASSFTNVASCLTNLRTLDQISKIIKKYNPKKIIITYEGHSWEKIVINYIKKNCSEIKIVGYQFSFLKKEDSLLLMNLPKFFYPDEILTVGNLNFDLLRKSQLYKNCHIDILGSPKFSKPKKIKKFIKACLVLTGLNRIDFYNFFYFTRKLAITFTDYKFIFRMHPQSVMSNYFSNKIALPKNMIISKNNINHDISKSFFAIHGSSTSIFTCLSKGMWPLYYDYSNINTNILHSLNLKNTKIKKVEDFNRIIKQKYFFNNNYYLINKYFKDYYASLNFNVSIFK
jgi:hypothetical protein